MTREGAKNMWAHKTSPPGWDCHMAPPTILFLWERVVKILHLKWRNSFHKSVSCTTNYYTLHLFNSASTALLCMNCGQKKVSKVTDFILIILDGSSFLGPNYLLLWWQISVKIQDINRVSSFSRCLNWTVPWRNYSVKAFMRRVTNTIILLWVHLPKP